MIKEITWHKVESRRKQFAWHTVGEGLQLQHENGNPPYVIPWSMCFSIFRHAMLMARDNQNVVTVGTHQTKPSRGSLGEWVLSQSFVLKTGNLTPRHLSFLGPIFARMGNISRRYNGNSIQWVFGEMSISGEYPVDFAEFRRKAEG
ncbi:MAG: hypothetical protein PHD01_15085 [Geobacteraceae bacterium]|nr:hypothetical protein [Geobacteraceae bacterium]